MCNYLETRLVIIKVMLKNEGRVQNSWQQSYIQKQIDRDHQHGRQARANPGQLHEADGPGGAAH